MLKTHFSASNASNLIKWHDEGHFGLFFFQDRSLFDMQAENIFFPKGPRRLEKANAPDIVLYCPSTTCPWLWASVFIVKPANLNIIKKQKIVAWIPKNSGAVLTSWCYLSNTDSINTVARLKKRQIFMCKNAKMHLRDKFFSLFSAGLSVSYVAINFIWSSNPNDSLTRHFC